MECCSPGPGDSEFHTALWALPFDGQCDSESVTLSAPSCSSLEDGEIGGCDEEDAEELADRERVVERSTRFVSWSTAQFLGRVIDAQFGRKRFPGDMSSSLGYLEGEAVFRGSMCCMFIRVVNGRKCLRNGFAMGSPSQDGSVIVHPRF